MTDATTVRASGPTDEAARPTGQPTAEPAAATGPPEGWGAGMWRLSGHSEVPGWLLLPAQVDDTDAWVAAGVAEIESAWQEHWRPEQAPVVAALLRNGLIARPDEAALAFQLWPVPAPLVAHVHASFGARPAGLVLGPDDGVLYDAAGLGQGIQLPLRVHDDAAGVDLIGVQLVFLSADAAVQVTFEPTVPELFGMLVGQFHAVVQSLELVGPDGQPVLAHAPQGFPDAAADATWPGSLPAV